MATSTLVSSDDDDAEVVINDGKSPIKTSRFLSQTLGIELDIETANAVKSAKNDALDITRSSSIVLIVETFQLPYSHVKSDRSLSTREYY